MTTFEIDKNVPIPTFRSSFGVRNTMRTMEVGDSFCLPTTSRSSNAYTSAKFAGIKIQCQKQPDGKVRIWRVE